MSLLKYLLNETITQDQFKRDAEKIATKMGYDYKYPEEWTIKVMSSTFAMLFENEKSGYNKELLTEYVPTLRELFPYKGSAYRALTIDIPTFGRLYSVIKNKFSNEQKKLFEILVQYAKGEIKKSKEIEDTFNEAVKLFLENTTDFRGTDFDSWSKSMNGIKYFQRHQHGNHNVVIKANIEGLDLLAMADFVNEYYGKNIFADRYRHTERVEEIIAPMSKTVDIVESRVLKKRKQQPKQTSFL